MMVEKQVRQKAKLTPVMESGRMEMAYSSTQPRSRGVKVYS